MSRHNIQVLGLCRWSYPSAPGAFRWTATDLADIRAELYSRERLETRLFYLEHLTVPCMRAQIDGDFQLLLMMGEEMPDWAKERVLALVDGVDQIVPVFLPEGLPHREACREVMLAARDENAKVIAEFRLDDDDAVASEFVSLSRDAFQKMRPLFYDTSRMAIDFSRGMIMDFTAETIDVHPVSARCWTPGLVLYGRHSNQNSLLDYPHLELWHRMDVLNWQREPMFVRGSHFDNDSALNKRIGSKSEPPYELDDVEAVLQVRFGIDLPAMRAAWGELMAKHGRRG